MHIILFAKLTRRKAEKQCLKEFGQAKAELLDWEISEDSKQSF